MIKPVLPFAEIMVTQACNLSCHGCTNYSDLVHKGYLTWQQGREQIAPWLERLDIPDFGIIGGEPMLNPEIQQWLIGIRELLPKSQIRFTTNGLLLKNMDVIRLCHDIGNVVFKITKHLDSPEIDSIIDEINSNFEWETVTEFGITRQKTSNNLRLQINQPKTFLKTYLGNYKTMRPHNSVPEESFAICCQRTCPLIYNGKLYKCSTTGLLEDTLKRFGHLDDENWKPFLTSGLSPDCSDAELKEFIDNFEKPHKTCGQCPTIKDAESHVIHYNNISKRKYV
jgi:organic radical activating enzyme